MHNIKDLRNKLAIYKKKLLDRKIEFDEVLFEKCSVEACCILVNELKRKRFRDKRILELCICAMVLIFVEFQTHYLPARRKNEDHASINH